MEIYVNQLQMQPGVAFIKIIDTLDATNYLKLFDIVSKLHLGDYRQIIMDFSQVRFISLSGIVALHWSLLILNGYKVNDIEDGWGSLHAVANESRPLKKLISLVGMQPDVQISFFKTNIKDYFEIFQDLERVLIPIPQPLNFWNE